MKRWSGGITIRVLLTAVIFGGLVSPASALAQELKTQNVFLITTDGLRWQEVFSGADEQLLNKPDGGIDNVDQIKAAYWRETPEERRKALLPFFWTTIAKEGQIFGNQDKGSIVQITNTMKFSYPGYNEILTGFADPAITSNNKIPNQNMTVLEWLHRKPAFDGKVAAYSGWDVTPFIINRERCEFPVMGGWEPVPDPEPNDVQKMINELIADTTPHHPSELTDSILYQAARAHIIRHQPRVMFIGFLETDMWGHRGKYDNLLNTANRADDYIRRLWELVQSMDQYRDKTTFIISTDHGRGFAPKEWKSHGVKFEGSENMWVAVIGPDTPALGERTDCDRVTQSQIAATLAALLGEDYRAEVPRAGEPIADVLPRK